MSDMGNHLWVDTYVICEEKVSSELGSLTRVDFWEGGQEAVENDNLVAMDNAEHFYCRPRIGEGLGNGGVSLSGEFKSRSYR
jgi:hypothetical protein